MSLDDLLLKVRSKYIVLYFEPNLILLNQILTYF